MRGKILQWSFARREKVLFFPDQHLGRWTGYLMDIPLCEMLVWDPDEPMGGLTPQQIKMARILAVERPLLGPPDVSGRSTCCGGASRIRAAW